MKDITDADDAHANRVCRNSEIKYLNNNLTYMFKVIHYC